MLSWLSGKKTYITAIVGLVTTWGAFLQGTMTQEAAIQASFGLVLAMFLRAGISKSGPTS